MDSRSHDRDPPSTWGTPGIARCPVALLLTAKEVALEPSSRGPGHNPSAVPERSPRD